MDEYFFSNDILNSSYVHVTDWGSITISECDLFKNNIIEIEFAPLEGYELLQNSFPAIKFYVNISPSLIYQALAIIYFYFDEIIEDLHKENVKRGTDSLERFMNCLRCLGLELVLTSEPQKYEN